MNRNGYDGRGLFTGRTTSTKIDPVGVKQAESGCPLWGIVLTSTPISPAARLVMSPAELDATIEAHARRVEAEEAAEPATRSPRCWACGAIAPKQSHNVEFGWRSRLVVIEKTWVSENYCPDCFAEWGWPKPLGGVV